MNYYFSAEKMSVGYRKQPVLEHVEISLKKGEILTLIGPNGAGKSTILKSIAGQLELITGVVRLDGSDFLRQSAVDRSRKMAVLLTDRLRTELMTCEEVAATGRYPYTGRFGILSGEDRRIVREAMELVHVETLKDCEFTKISDGQRQRVMLARAICQEPEILILDEPTSFLDIRYKLEFLSVLQELRKKKDLTVIMSLHELELACRVSDKILCVAGNNVDRFGTPEEIFVPGYLNRLFSVTAGSFDEENTGMELEACRKPPEVFVLGGEGAGRMTYRRLQRSGIPFATGILYENDLDFPAARALASELVSVPAFEPVPGDLVEKARRIMDSCWEVICPRTHFGSLDRANRELLAYAKKCGKIKVDTKWQK